MLPNQLMGSRFLITIMVMHLVVSKATLELIRVEVKVVLDNHILLKAIHALTEC